MSAPAENLRGILLMVAAMAGFAVEDSLIKLAAERIPTGLVILTLGGAGAAVFALWARATGAALFGRAARCRPLWLRTLSEMVATMGFVTALATIPLSTATAVLQAAPILVMAGAALILGETVGWRRWTAAGVGFLGMLLILRPEGGAFDPFVLFAVIGTLGLAARDLATRRMPKDIPTPVVAAWGNAGVAVMGALMLALSGGAVAPDGDTVLLLAGAVGIGFLAYWAVIEATRHGDVSAIAPFRYTRLVFALICSVLIFAETLSVPVLIGSLLIVGSGLYIFAREKRVAALSQQPV